jgi:hypothetical protein
VSSFDQRRMLTSAQSPSRRDRTSPRRIEDMCGFTLLRIASLGVMIRILIAELLCLAFTGIVTSIGPAADFRNASAQISHFASACCYMSSLICLLLFTGLN